MAKVAFVMRSVPYMALSPIYSGSGAPVTGLTLGSLFFHQRIVSSVIPWTKYWFLANSKPSGLRRG